MRSATAAARSCWLTRERQRTIAELFVVLTAPHTRVLLWSLRKKVRKPASMLLSTHIASQICGGAS